MKQLLLYSTLFGLLFFLHSCLKEDVTNIEAGKNNLTPEYALPIGTSEFYVNDYMAGYSSIPDTTGQYRDSLLYYEGEFYKNPYRVTYSVTEPFSLGSNAANMEYIISAMFRINAVNDIPASVEVQVYFLDFDQVPFDSLYDSGPLLIPAATTDVSGVVINSSEKWKVDAYLDSSEINILGAVQYIQIHTVLEFPPPGAVFIPFDSTQNIWIQLGGKIKLNIAL